MPCDKAEAEAATSQQEIEAATLLPEAAQEIEDEIAHQLLLVQNGNLPMRTQAAHHLAASVRTLGAGPLFNQILPQLMSPTLDERPWEHGLLLHVVERALCELGELVRPYAHKLCVVLEPLLIDDDHEIRVRGRALMTYLARAAGAATMLNVMRPDVDAADEYVRNVTARGLAVVASALGVRLLLPFFRAVCQSKSSWQARHTGIRIVQQLAILLGHSVRPHLRALVRMIEKGLGDEHPKVRTITALALAALAQSVKSHSPHRDSGAIAVFGSVLKPLWTAVRRHCGRRLAAALQAVGSIVPLMDAEYAHYYSRELMPILLREIESPDALMRRTVLQVIKRCVATEGVQSGYGTRFATPSL